MLYGPARRGGWQVRHCSRRAVAQGVRPGLPLSEAQSFLEKYSPQFVEHDPGADREALQAVAVWCQRFSPHVGLDDDPEPSCLFLDVTGSAHLFGGEEQLTAQVQRDLSRGGYDARVCAADTIGAAWAAVHFERTTTVIPPGRHGAVMSGLPLEALRLPLSAMQTLHELGIQAVRQLQALPRSSLPSRFGADVVLRLDQALGLAPELIVPVHAPEPVEAEWSFEEPVSDQRTIEFVVRQLFEDVTTTLAPRQEGVQQLSCRLFCARHEPVTLTMGSLRPTTDVVHLADLFQLQIERTTVPEEIVRVQIAVTATGRLTSQQRTCLETEQRPDEDRQLLLLLNRLSHRLGPSRVLRPMLFPDPLPEYAHKLTPLLPEQKTSPAKKRSPKPASRAAKNAVDPLADYRLVETAGARPLCLKRRPVPVEALSIVPEGPPIRVRWGQIDRAVARAWGPERIEAGWWRGCQTRRDYYRVEMSSGQRLWLFRRHADGAWYLHGTFE